MKSEQEIIDEIRRANEVQSRLEEHGDEYKATAMMNIQTALLWVIEEIDTSEVDMAESILRIMDEHESTPDKSSSST